MVRNVDFCFPSRVMPVYLDLKFTSQVFKADVVAIRCPRFCKWAAVSSKVPSAPASGQRVAVRCPPPLQVDGG